MMVENQNIPPRVTRPMLESAITGAIRSTIEAHGPITKTWAPSAAKRVIGHLKQQGFFREQNEAIAAQTNPVEAQSGSSAPPRQGIGQGMRPTIDGEGTVLDPLRTQADAGTLRTSSNCPYCPGPAYGWGMGLGGWENMKAIHEANHV